MMARQAGRIYIGDNRMEIQGKERDRRKVKEYKRKTLEKKKSLRNLITYGEAKEKA